MRSRFGITYLAFENFFPSYRFLDIVNSDTVTDGINGEKTKG